MRIVMVCTGNTCRSPMAEALMRRALARRGVEGVTVESCGTFTRSGYPASAEAVTEMESRGLDIRDHRSERMDRRDLRGALALCMTGGHLRELLRMHPSAQAHTLLGYAGLTGDITDPIGMGQAAYKKAADDMQKAVDIIADGIAKQRGR